MTIKIKKAKNKFSYAIVKQFLIVKLIIILKKFQLYAYVLVMSTITFNRLLRIHDIF